MQSDDPSHYFLELATEDEMRDCFRDFHAATANESLRLNRCVVCVCELGTEDGETLLLLDDPYIRDLLPPSHDHSGQVLWHGALVLQEEIEETEGGNSGWICTEYGSALWKEKVPWFALANSLWIGEMPSQLTILTIPEQMLIARHYPRCYVFKLYPRGGGYLSSDVLQSGMKGNVSLYELNTQDVVRMLEGQMMPNLTSTLASVLAITCVGTRTMPKDWLKSTFRVRHRS